MTQLLESQGLENWPQMIVFQAAEIKVRKRKKDAEEAKCLDTSRKRQLQPPSMGFMTWKIPQREKRNITNQMQKNLRCEPRRVACVMVLGRLLCFPNTVGLRRLSYGLMTVAPLTSFSYGPSASHIKPIPTTHLKCNSGTRTFPNPPLPNLISPQ